jgi:phosphatidylglycerol:prolipoprotein diacylglycerol transferase
MISPVANSFFLFGLDIKYYSVVIFLALVCAFFVCVFLIKKYYKDKVSLDFFYDLFPVVILSGILGARLYYVLLSLPYFLKNPAEIFAIWDGGISIQGGILFGVLAGLVYSKIKKVSFLVLADALIPALPLAQAIGRWGNYFNQEAFGAPTNLPWGLYIEPKFRPLEFINNEYFHPTFLYESILNLIIFIVLFVLVKKFKGQTKGQIFFLYFVLYSIVRFFVEGIRIDSVLNISGIPVAQIVSAIMFLVGIIGFVLVNRNDRL